MHEARALPIEAIGSSQAAPAWPVPTQRATAPAREQVAARAAALYRDHGPAVYRRCRRLLRDRDAAADATQEVFLRLVRSGEALAGRADLLPWLLRVATNHCLNLLRDARGRREEPLGLDDEADGRSGPASLAERLVRRVLARFDEVTQAIAVGIIVEGREAEEVARRLGVSRRTVSRKLERFLEHARRQLTIEPATRAS